MDMNGTGGNPVRQRPGTAGLTRSISYNEYGRIEGRPTQSFPQYGKHFRRFSTLWKKCFHGVENSGLGLILGWGGRYAEVAFWRNRL